MSKISTYKLVSFLIALGLFVVGCGPTEKPQVEPTEKYVNENIFVGKCIITHYCICEKCCGKKPTHPAYGITKSGRKAIAGVSVAVDESVIPLGSEVIIDYGNGDIQHYRADDTGNAIKGNRIDVCVESHQIALEMGKKTGTIYYIPKMKE